ncbi:hypothetical protein Bca52824_027868 [Brassica carinata]|uniref:Uncharacterized protein n=1 Tax=Brassica carinata TaxID=52824 RepID=A0A8X7VB89_BRACI|nr:hypothetical protein Bca52824_027868 [Brassica carinata]
MCGVYPRANVISESVTAIVALGVNDTDVQALPEAFCREKVRRSGRIGLKINLLSIQFKWVYRYKCLSRPGPFEPVFINLVKAIKQDLPPGSLLPSIPKPRRRTPSS